MTQHCRRFLLIAVLTMSAVVVAPSLAAAQDALTRARDLYESAEYEQALQLLGSIKDKVSSEAAAYQVFCLVALGRQEEAKVAVQNLVRKDPLYRPGDAQVSPRLRAFFDDIRRPLLPEVTRASYARAKAAFDKKDWSTATDEFTRVLAVLDEQSQADEGAQDLRTLASGFRDLADAARAASAAKPAVTPTPTSTPAPSPTPTPTATPTSTASSTASSPTKASERTSSGSSESPTPSPAPAIYSDEDTEIIKPVPVVRELPGWFPTGIEREQTFAGIIELVVGENGKVLSAKMVKSVNPRYDPSLLDASKSWTFKPATKDGAPVKYRYAMAVNLLPR